VNDLEATLESLTMNQLRKPDAVYVTLPVRSSREKEPLEYSLPGFLLDNSRFGGLVEIVPIEIDLGPVSKLFGGIIKEHDDQTSIVVCDDDIIYGPHWLQRLESEMNLLKEDENQTAIGFGSFDLMSTPPFFRMSLGGIKNAPKLPTCFKYSSNTDNVGCLMGVCGALYKRSFFTTRGIETLKRWSENERLRRADDVTISAWLSIAGIKRKLITNPPQESQDRTLANPLSASWIKAIYNHCYAYQHLQRYESAFPTTISSIKQKSKTSSTTTQKRPYIPIIFIILTLIIFIFIISYFIIQSNIMKSSTTNQSLISTTQQISK